jgi:hypothetical protein
VGERRSIFSKRRDRIHLCGAACRDERSAETDHEQRQRRQQRRGRIAWRYVVEKDETSLVTPSESALLRVPSR